MISVKANYINAQSKVGTDYFIFTDIEVVGHSEHTGSYTNNIRLCAGVSACCYGILRVIDDAQFKYECRSGYFHIWTDRTIKLRQELDRASVYALNTLICQLFELYEKYKTSFSSFDLVDIKEILKNDERKNKPRKKRNKRMGFYSLIEETYSQEN